MKKYLFHGDDQSASRKRLNEIVEKARLGSWEVFNLTWGANIKGELLMLSRSQSLLANEKLIVIENFFTGNKKALETIEEIGKNNTGMLAFWEDKPVTVSIIKKLPNEFIVQEFKLPVAVFKFLESIYPGNSKASINLFHQAIETDQAEFLIYMISRHVRLLIWAKEDTETLKVADWQKKKLMSQAGKFTNLELLSLHNKLLELDRMNKRSQLVGNLAQNLEVLVTTI